ncbi:MAG: MBL fold metallo-hydrolase [Anaerolineae bacterium]|nr:MBL fold metallo-hydrolase [Anaerolineae bacterium]
MITLTILYDNQRGDPRLKNAWGFACLVETSGTQLLFDTGGDAPTLLNNAALLEKDLTAVDQIVLSHYHGDHTGGLQGLLATGVSPTVYMLASFSPSMRRAAAEQTAVVEVTGPQEIVPGIWTTGEVSGPVAEQALIVETTEGWVLITGCAHPGVERMTERALEITGGPIRLVLGGFHLGSAGPVKIQDTIAALEACHVAAVAPTHCTGDRARAAFAEAYGEAFHAAGAGTSWAFEQPPHPGRPKLEPE